MIRSDFFRMVRMKSFMIIMVIVGVLNVASLVAAKAIQNDEAYQEYLQKVMEEAAKEDPSASDIGMSITIKTDENGDYDALELMRSFLGGYMALLFLGIFVVIFVTADFNNGYIKNYGGQLRFRTRLLCSKSVCMVAFTAFLFVLTFVTSCIGVWMTGAAVKIADGGMFAKYVGVQFLLHVAFAIVISAICVIVRNNLVTMVLCCCIAMNVIGILYRLADKLLHKLGWKNADITNYTVSGRIAKYSETANMLGSTLIIAVAFCAAAILIGGLWLRKKDFV